MMSWLGGYDDENGPFMPPWGPVAKLTSVPLTIEPRLFDGLSPEDMMESLAVAWTDGQRFGDVNYDKGTIEPVSAIGLETKHRAEDLYHAGEHQFKEKRYKEAIELYTKTLELSVRIRDNGEFLGFAFCARSKAYRMDKKYKLSKEDAVHAMRCFPVNMAIVLNFASALEATGNFDDTFVVCLRALKCYDTETIYQAKLLKIAVQHAPKTPNGVECLEERAFPQEIWNLVLAEFAKEEAWGTVRILMMGTDDTTALVTSCDASDIVLSGLVETCREVSWKQWGQKLTIMLIKQGAGHNSLCSEKKFPFHVALRIGLKTDTFDLLKWLFQNKGYDGKCMDRSGNSLLHLACRSNANSKETAIKLLLNHNTDPNIKNNDGKLASDYLTEGSQEYKLIQQKMTKPPADDGRVAKEASQTARAMVPFVSPVSRTPAGVAVPDMTSAEFVKSWSKMKIRNWLDSKGLGKHKHKFKDMDGALLFELKMMQVTAPEMFFKILETSLDLPLVDILRLSSCLRSISQDYKTH